MIRSLFVRSSFLALILILCSGSMILCSGSIACAQPPTTAAGSPATSTSSAIGPFSAVTIGPFFTAGESKINTDIPAGFQTDPRFAYTIGGSAYASFSDLLGVHFALAYDTRDAYYHNDAEGSNVDLSLGYITIQPSLRLFWLLVGLSFDVPMSASATMNVPKWQHLGLTQDYAANRDVPTSDLNSLVEIRGQLNLPLYRGESGALYGLLGGSYPLTHQTVRTTANFDSTGHFTGTGGGPIPTFQAGLTYQFDVRKIFQE